MVGWSGSVIVGDGVYTYQANVDGTVCAFFAYSVSKKIYALEGDQDESVMVDLKNGDVEFVSTTVAKKNELSAVFSASGFSLTGLREVNRSILASDQFDSSAKVILRLDKVDSDEIENVLSAIGEIAST